MKDSDGIIQKDIGKLFDLIIDTGAFQYNEKQPFHLTSGKTSPYYFDLKLLNGHPEGINAVAKVFYHYIREMPGVQAVGGLESGSISIATAISQLSYFEHKVDPLNPLITSFFVRKSAKKHGTMKLIEGSITSPVVIIDDVITSGMSAIAAVRAVQERCECKSLMSIVFRGTEEDHKNIEKECKLRYIFHKDQLVEQFRK